MIAFIDYVLMPGLSVGTLNDEAGVSHAARHNNKKKIGFWEIGKVE